MGASPQSQLVAISMKGSMLQGNEQSCSSTANGSSLWGKIMEAQGKRRWQGIRKQRRMIPRRHLGGHVKLGKRPTGILMKKMARSGSRKHANGIGRKVRTLKRLVPNSESMGLDGLFRETADYILSLQMRVRVMQTMVDALTNSDHEY
ncbi:hypothetical protein F2P56_024989 [Juglans regia]|uniref:Transcription factor UPBEAT1-like n=2 Tax=Juglans regia TaxID=51240 RepID=A0A833UDQ3_JUGRE|nr:transcription factor UPBEAT1 [Juglans regia]KAF5455412.1 hypothetical protein F2P56_024989 [Juglans regia]